MKSTVRIFLSVFILALGFASLHAQKGQGRTFDPVQKAEKQTTHMTEKLSLTPQQATKVKEINLKYAQQQKDLKGQPAKGDSKDRTAIKQLNDNRMSEINQVLSKEQQAKWQQLQAERKQQRGKSRKAGMGFSPEQKADRMTQHMTDNLGLTNEQAAKVKAINQEFATKKQALAKDKQKGQKTDKAAMQQLRDQHKAELKKVLSKQQYDKMEQMKKDRNHDKGSKVKGNKKQELKGKQHQKGNPLKETQDM